MKKYASILICALLVICMFSSCKKAKETESSYSFFSVYDDIPNKSESKSKISGKENKKSSNHTVSSVSTGLGEIIDIKIDKSDLKQVETAKIRVKQDRLTVFSYLSSSRQEIYKKMLKAAEDFTEGWIDLGNLGSDKEKVRSDIAVAYQALGDDYPELFWLPASYYISSSSDQTAICFSGNISGTKCSYLVSKSKVASMKKELEEKAEEIVKATENISTQYEVELYLHDYLCENTEYDLNSEFKYTAFGALVSKKAVCEGYSRAFAMLCSKAGINSFIMRGTSRNQNHSWNLVNIENSWYNIDITWDDQTSSGAKSALYSYFNLTDAEILSDHTAAPFINPKSGIIPNDGVYNLTEIPCSDSNMNYFNKEKLILENNNYDDLSNAISIQNSKNKKFAQIKVNPAISEDPSEIMRKMSESLKRCAGISLKSMSTVDGTNYLLIRW